jgi:hypothetical protein
MTDVSPSSGPNTGTYPVQVTIHGTGFVQGIHVWMKHCYVVGQVDGTVSSVSPTTVTATFQMYGQPPGTWKMWAQNVPDNTNPQGNVWVLQNAFTLYDSSSPGTTTTTTPTVTTTETTTVTPTTTPARGKYSVFFETNPSGATIFMDGIEVGTSSFTYYTDTDGSFSVVAKKTGYEDSEGKVTIVEGQRAHFYALLTPLSSTTTTTAVTGVTTTDPTAKTNTTPQNATISIRKSTLKIPTPLGTDPPITAQESPVDPVIAICAAGIAMILVVIRRR